MRLILQRGAQRVDAIRQALRNDTTLAEMARTPLLLSIFVLAYLDAPLTELPLGRSQPEVLPILFATYIKQMLRRRGLLKSGSTKQALERLTFLAKQMRNSNQTVFSIEALQAEGISDWQVLICSIIYALMIGLFFLLVIGPIYGLAAEMAQWGNAMPISQAVSQFIAQMSIEQLNEGLVNGLSMGAVIGFFSC